MKIGVNILNFGPGANAGDLLRWAQLSEALGYHSIMLSDHVAVTPTIGQRYPEPWFDAFTTLAWLAGQTTRLRLGTTVIVLPYRHPLHTARLVSNLDLLSGGRFDFGIGIGNAEDEFRALGQPHNRRGRLSDEALEAMLQLWQAESPVSYHGRLVNFDEVAPMRCAQQPHPPVWVGGNTESAWRRCARFGDAWHPIIWRNLTIAWARDEGMATIRRLARQAGRPEPAFCPRIRLELRDQPIDGERQPGTGSLEQVWGDLRELEAAGAQHVTLDWYTGDLEATRDHAHGWHQLSLLADQVLDLPGERVK